MAKIKGLTITPPKDKAVPIFVPTLEEQALLEKVGQRFDESKTSKQIVMNKMNHSYLQFKSISYYNSAYGLDFLEGFGLRVFVPKTFETIESIIPQINGRPPEFIVKGQNPTDNKKSRYVNIVLTNEWNRANAQKQFTIATFDSLVLGTGILFNYLRDDKRMVDDIDKVDDEGNVTEYVKREFTDYFGVYTEARDPFFQFPDPNADCVDACRYWVDMELVDCDELKAEYKLRGFNGNWQYLTPGGDLEDYGRVRQEVDRLYTYSNLRYPGNISDLLGSSHKTQDNRPKRNLIGKMTYWEKDRLVVIANGVILRDTPNPYPHKRIPYTLIRDYVLSHEFWGMGEPEVMRWLQVEANTLHNQALDASSMAVGQMIAVNSAYIKDEAELVVKPFGIIHLKNIPGISVSDAIQPIVTPDVKNSVFRMMQVNKEMTQAATGISDFYIGGSRGASDTATEANKLADASAARIREKARILEDEGVKDVVEQWLPITAQLYSDEMNFRVTDKDKTEYFKFVPLPRKQITPEVIALYQGQGYSDIISMDDLRGGFDIYVKGASTLPVNKQTAQQMWIQLANLTSKLVWPDGTPVGKIDKVYENVLYSYDIPDAPDYVNHPATAIAPAPVPTSTEIAPVPSEADNLNQAAQPVNFGVNATENL